MNIYLSPEIISLLMFISVVVLIMLGYPIAFTLGGIAIIFALIFMDVGAGNLLMLKLMSQMSDYLLVAIPLFVFMGVVIEKSGIAMRLYDSLYVLLGPLPGGLALATVATCTFFAAATGIVGASIVTMSLIALPAMLKYNYDKSLATGGIAAGGTLGILIPPSILLLIYGPTAGISVGALFVSAIIPGLVLSSLYMLFIFTRCFFNPSLGPALPKSEIKITARKKLYMFSTSVLPVAFLIAAVIGSIFFGLAAPTEAAGMGAFASLILAACYKKLNFTILKDVVFRSLVISCMSFMVLIGAGFFSIIFIRLGGGRVVSNIILNLPFPEWGILISMLLIVFFMGMFLDFIGTIMIVVPIFTPIAAQLGFDPIWFAMMVIVVMQSSFLSPPFAISIFYLKGVAPPEIKTSHIYKGVVPFILIQLLVVMLIGFYPGMATWLPYLMVGR